MSEDTSSYGMTQFDEEESSERIVYTKGRGTLGTSMVAKDETTEVVRQ